MRGVRVHPKTTVCTVATRLILALEKNTNHQSALIARLLRPCSVKLFQLLPQHGKLPPAQAGSGRFGLIPIDSAMERVSPLQVAPQRRTFPERSRSARFRCIIDGAHRSPETQTDNIAGLPGRCPAPDATECAGLPEKGLFLQNPGRVCPPMPRTKTAPETSARPASATAKLVSAAPKKNLCFVSGRRAHCRDPSVFARPLATRSAEPAVMDVGAHPPAGLRQKGRLQTVSPDGSYSS